MKISWIKSIQRQLTAVTILIVASCNSHIPQVTHHLVKSIDGKKADIHGSAVIGYEYHVEHDEYYYNSISGSDTTSELITDEELMGGFQFALNTTWSNELLKNLYLDYYSTLSLNIGFGLGLSYLVHENLLLNIYGQSNYVLIEKGLDDPILHGIQIKYLLKDKLLLGLSYDKSSIVQYDTYGSMWSADGFSQIITNQYYHNYSIELGTITNSIDFLIKLKLPADFEDYTSIKLIIGQSTYKNKE